MSTFIACSRERPAVDMMPTLAIRTDGPNQSSRNDSGRRSPSLDGNKDKQEKHVVGMLLESKDLYAKFDDRGNRSWTEKLPNDFEEQTSAKELAKYAVIVRRGNDAEADKALIIDSIIVQSPHIRRLLAKVLHGYPGIITNLLRLKLMAPLECLVHRWKDLETAVKDTLLEQEAREHIDLFYSIVDKELGQVVRLRDDYLAKRAVTFEHVWTLFPPGCIVVGSMHQRPLAAKLESAYYRTRQCGKFYVLHCKIIDWDGTRMGWTSHDMFIPAFEGAVPLSKLCCQPLDLHADAEGVREMLQARGKVFESLAGYCFRAYDGVALWHPQANETQRETVQSRIVVDGFNWEKENCDHNVWIMPLHQEQDTTGFRRSRRRRRLSFSSQSSSPSPSVQGYESSGSNNDSEPRFRDLDLMQGANGLENKMQQLPLTPSQLILTTPIVRGYALRNKRWMEFFIDKITDVSFDEDAFSTLVMPADKKELVLALARSQSSIHSAFDDVITGKGRGIVMLLSGSPGTGKTLTAEAVAEEIRLPLYAVSAGDLGSDSWEMERKLSQVLSMVASWNAVLLIDECDIFLQQRTRQDLERNRIIAVFLRTLEYYQGILFLTTNRVGDIDPAFQSRIHISIEYPPLNIQARAAIWKTLLKRAVVDQSWAKADSKGVGQHQVTEAEIDTLSRLEINGRVIKNMIKAAHLLACHRQQALSYEHLQAVERVEGSSRLAFGT
ncbi:hypothetical protein CDD82_5807 [Ophiocordyceps australis]|uniref:AAA+ ATPase domain-containing protein n=1 Tax=Ophiocordyceps australis TaxID=1399860 RepID=A0A2C5YZ32_9HYPO|nr:hypothetical protein CDD82_5807 [Ophiocordyceps australis]